MRLDLMALLDEHDELDQVLILTYNLELRFVESVLLPQLRKCGDPHLTILADARRALDSFDREADQCRGLGRRYRVVPIPMQYPYAFHPKAVLLRGSNNASLVVGSGNLSFGGWRLNGEIWSSFDWSNPIERPAFAEFDSFVGALLDEIALSEQAERAIKGACYPSDGSGPTESSDSEEVLVTSAGERSLWQQMDKELGSRDVRGITVSTPYFDDRGEMLGRIASAHPDAKVKVAVQDESSNLTQRSLERIQSEAKVEAVDFKTSAGESRFLHAKFFAFDCGDDVVVFRGSANCSVAALGLPNGNVELLARSVMTPREYEQKFCEELTWEERVPAVSKVVEGDEEDTGAGPINILSACFDHRRLRVAYRLEEGVSLEKCVVLGEAIPLNDPVGNEFEIEIDEPPRSVQLTGIRDGQAIESRKIWVDIESDLRASKGARSLATAVREHVSSENWSIGGWEKVFSVLDGHFKPSANVVDGSISLAENSDRGARADGGAKYEESDVFIDSLDLPEGSMGGVAGVGAGGTLRLRDAILGMLGQRWADDSDRGSRNDSPIPDPSDSSERRSSTAKQRRSARRTVEKAVPKFLRDDFLATRSARNLNHDINVLGTLLVFGGSEGWLEESVFRDMTHEIWTSLFSSGTTDEGCRSVPVGWLEYRHRYAESRPEFERFLVDPKLAVTLVTWALSMPNSTDSRADAEFELACSYAFARVPWLWQHIQTHYPPEELAEEFRIRLRTLGLIEPEDTSGWESYRKRWNELTQRGRALLELEAHLERARVKPLADNIERKELQRGELLWQGPYQGFCCAAEDSQRTDDCSIAVASPLDDSPNRDRKSVV